MNGSEELRKKYLKFFEGKNHKVIESYSLIPDNDNSVLFTTAGMHPLVPFLMGHKHPLGGRLVNVQKCIRTGDIDDVGDDVHFTFFEMLGNWSLGDYFKEESIKMSYDFLVEEIKLDKRRLAVSCFEGDNNIPKDEESANVWLSCGISKGKIKFLGKKDNWWGPAGLTGPCGPDTEIFYWNSIDDVPKVFDEGDKRWVEIWNNVFMEYEKQKDGSYISLKQKNVDTGMGLERVAMILEGVNNVYEIASIKPIFDKVKEIAKLDKLDEVQLKSVRIIVDHMRAATFILGDNKRIVPSNVDQGYILRRFIRRAIRHLRILGVDIYKGIIIPPLAELTIDIFGKYYVELSANKDFIISELKKEEENFKKTLEKGLRKFKSMAQKGNINAEDAFFLFQTYGFPIELIAEFGKEKDIDVDVKGFDNEFKKHQALSRVGAEKKFKGGLSENSDMTKRLHTATHILNEVLRHVLGKDVKQRGSNITSERLRFDFNFDRKLTDEEKKKIEDKVNGAIQKGIPIIKKQMNLQDALDSGAQAEFGAKYPEKVWVYTIGECSKEICNGPHVENTNELGKFRIKKEQSSSAGIRRIKAVLE